MKNLKDEKKGFGFITKVFLLILLVLITCICNGQKLMLEQPDFRESNRLFFIFWEACKADNRCYGMCYLKNRRSGFSFMASGETC